MSDITPNTSATTGQEAELPMTIGDLSDITGLSISAIRFYQRRGVLPARDSGTGWQRFSHDTLDRLAVIELAKSAGFSLDEIIRILDAFDTDPDTAPAKAEIWHGLAEHKITDIDAQIARLEGMRQLLKDALDYSYISPDRARRATAALGWVDPLEPEAPLLALVQVPTSAKDLHAASPSQKAPVASSKR